MKSTQIIKQQLDRSSTIGFIGLGAMGIHMLHNLIKNTPNHPSTGRPASFVICDNNPEAITRNIERQRKEHPNVRVEVGQSPEEVAMKAGTIISMIPASSHVRSVYTSSSNSVLSALKSGKLSEQQIKETLCMDESTIEMPASKEVCEAIEAAGGSMMDAPVSGGVVGAEKCTLTIMCGHPSTEVFERGKPVLGAMGRRVIHCGGWGMGLAAKTCNNMMLGISMVGLSEAVLLGKRLGLDAQLLGDIINTSTGQCWASSVNYPNPDVTISGSSPPSHRGYAGGFVTKLAHKDLAFAVAAAKRVDAPLFLGKLAEEVYRPIADPSNEKSNMDFSVMYKYLEEELGKKGMGSN